MDIKWWRGNAAIMLHVTEILQKSGIVDVRWYDTWSATRGTAVHLATRLYDEHNLAEDKLDPVLKPYLEAWKRFLAECEIKIEKIELPVKSERYKYEGRLDRLLKLNSKSGVLDIKTGTIQPWAALQVAAYAECVPDAKYRWAIQLKDDGKYSLQEFKNKNDFRYFVACKAVVDWKQANNTGVNYDRK